MVSINSTEWDLDPLSDPFIWIGLTLVGSVHVAVLSFDPCWVRPCCGHDFWYLVYPLWGYLSFLPLLGPSTSLAMVLTLGGSVHFVDWSWPLVGSVHFGDFVKVYDPGWVRPLCGLWSWPLVESVHFVDLYKFVTLVVPVHFVDWGLDLWWSLSTLWICISLWPWSGPSTLWTGLDTWWSLSTFVNLYKFMTLVRSVHFVNWGLDPWWGPSTDDSSLLVVITQQKVPASLGLKRYWKSHCSKTCSNKKLKNNQKTS